MAKNPSDVAAKWTRNLSGAVQSMKDGVLGVQTAPTAQAAQRADAYLQGVQAAVANGRWQAGLNRVTLQQWQDSMINKGIARVASGATAAQPKVAAFMGQLLPFIDAGQRQLASTPRGDINQNIQRAVAWMNYMATFRRS